MEKKDFSLLRPFDRAAAIRGEALCWEDGAPGILVAADDRGSVCIRWEHTNTKELRLYADGKEQERLRMAPLAWVEGKPVYKGDVLYVKFDGLRIQVTGYEECSGGLGKPCLTFNRTRDYIENFTWTPPKVKREVKLVAFIDDHGTLRWVREELFANRGMRVPTEDKTVEVEEPAA